MVSTRVLRQQQVEGYGLSWCQVSNMFRLFCSKYYVKVNSMAYRNRYKVLFVGFFIVCKKRACFAKVELFPPNRAVSLTIPHQYSSGENHDFKL